jgi:hypothetical protein
MGEPILEATGSNGLSRAEWFVIAAGGGWGAVETSSAV